MNGYDLILWAWSLGLVLAVGGAVGHYYYWRWVSDFQKHQPVPRHERRARVEARVLDGWVRDACFHFGLRVLLAIFALVRLLLQLDLPSDTRDSFTASPAQVGLALLFFLILLWATRWSRLTLNVDR